MNLPQEEKPQIIFWWVSSRDTVRQSIVSLYHTFEKKKDYYNEGGNITWENLMEKALNKYKTVDQEEIWKYPSQEKEHIVSLSTKL